MLLTDTQQIFVSSTRKYAQTRVRPQSAEFEAAGGYPTGLFEQLGQMGLFVIVAPEEYGGAASDYVSYALALIEVAAGDGALSTIVSIQNSIMVAGLLKDGTAEQRKRFLPYMIAGRVIGAFALTETDAGSDASAVRTLATKAEGGWEIDGSKQFITSGQIGGVAMVIAVTDPKAGKRGLTAFLVPTNYTGLTVGKVEHKLG